MPKPKKTAQEEFSEEWRELKDFMYRKFNWISQVERRRIKEEGEKDAD